MKYLGLIFLIHSAFALNFKVNDLAFLYPLKLEKESYLPIENIVGSQYLYNLTPKLKDNLNITYLVGVKLAPCATELDDTKCFHQVRLVFQGSFRYPGNLFKGMNVLFNDDAIHVFYNLSKRSFRNFLYYLKLRSTKGDSWIHNIVKNDTKAKKFNNRLKRLLKNKKPHLITAMEGDGVFKWDFFKVYPEKTPLNTANIFDISGFGLTNLSLTEASCAGTSRYTCEKDINIIVKKVRRITSASTHVDEVDCASCHLVDGLKSKLKHDRKNYIEVIQSGEDKEYFKKEFLTPPVRSQSNLRQLGYFGIKPSVSARTISELRDQLKKIKEVIPFGIK